MGKKTLQPTQVFVTIVESYVHGRMRINCAELAFTRTLLALSDLRGLSPTRWQGKEYAPALDQLHVVATKYSAPYYYVTYVSLLVYSTSLLDTFLSDATRFLLLLHPSALGRNHAVGLQALLSSTSLSQVITDSVERKVREVSHLPFLGRIEYLRERFGLAADLPEDTRAQLEHYSGVRNTAVHDQGFLELRLDSRRGLKLTQKACPRHPTPVTLDDLRTASFAHDDTVRVIAEAILRQVLKAKPDERTNSVLRLLSRDQKSGKTLDVVEQPEED